MLSGALSIESCDLKAMRTSIGNLLVWLATDKAMGDELEQLLLGIETEIFERSMLNPSTNSMFSTVGSMFMEERRGRLTLE